MSDPNQAPYINEQPGLFERIGSAVQDSAFGQVAVGAFERANMAFRSSSAGRIATGAMATLALGAGVETTSLASAAPVGTENVPAHASNSAGNMEQYCEGQIFNKKNTTVLSADMTKPGQEYQGELIRVGFKAIDPACNGVVRRMASSKAYLERGGKDVYLDSVWEKLLRGDTNGEADPGYEIMNSHQDPALYFHKGDKAKFKLRLQAYSEKAHKILKTVIRTFPVTVHGKPKK